MEVGKLGRHSQLLSLLNPTSSSSTSKNRFSIFITYSCHLISIISYNHRPTNHLSIDAVLWLSRELASSDIWSSRIIVVVSHDRCFLEDTCTDMCHISGVARRITQHPGRFSTWAARREEQQIAWKRRQELRQARREKMNDHASCGYKYGGSAVAMNMQSRMQRQIKESDKEAEAEEEALADLNEDEELPLTILAGGMLAKTAVQMFGVGFGYPGSEKLFRAVEMSVDSRSRICLLGENGQGKTTLLKLIMDTLMPSEGSGEWSKRLRSFRIAVR